MADEKPHPPSRRKLDKARKDGKVGKSRFLSQVIGVTGGLLSLALLAPLFYEKTAGVLALCWERDIASKWGLEPSGVLVQHSCPDEASFLLLQSLVAVLCVVVVLGVLVEVAQMEWKVVLAPLKVDPAKLNPVSGFSRLGSSLKGSWYQLTKLLAMVAVFAWFFSSLFWWFPWWFFGSEESAFRFSRHLTWRFLGLAGGSGLALGLVDFLIERRRFIRELSMTDQEVRQEYKEDEGDPLTKSLRRREHERLALEDLAQRVRKAKVIVVSRS